MLRKWIEKASGESLKYKAGNIAFERILSIAKQKQANLHARDLTKAIKNVVGTCVSLGVLVDSKEGKVVSQEIDEGKYEKEIKEEITEPTAEKKAELKAYFDSIQSEQEKTKKAEEEAAAAAEAEKAEKAAKKYNVDRIYDDAEELFQNESLDFVDIITQISYVPYVVKVNKGKMVSIHRAI